ncbi:hypothetical protein EDB86DRAFT_1907941 [Lactarius hatsudake]|nr:hypothetical protein EDB86DRAFT_1907941 [Lactarius hatsudake]
MSIILLLLSHISPSKRRYFSVTTLTIAVRILTIQFNSQKIFPRFECVCAYVCLSAFVCVGETPKRGHTNQMARLYLLFQSWRKITRIVRFLVSFVHSEELGHDNGRRLLYIAPRFVFDSKQDSAFFLSHSGRVLIKIRGTRTPKNRMCPIKKYSQQS